MSSREEIVAQIEYTLEDELQMGWDNKIVALAVYEQAVAPLLGEVVACLKRARPIIAATADPTLSGMGEDRVARALMADVDALLSRLKREEASRG